MRIPILPTILSLSCCLMAGCSAAPQDDASDPPIAKSQQKVVVPMYGGDNRGYTGDGDWALGYWKGECAATDVLVGVSRSTSPGWIHDLFCRKSYYTPFVSSGTTIDFRTRDARRDTTTGDWDPGYIKGECGYFEGVTGLAQDPNQVVRARCTVVAYSGYYSCHRRDFWQSDGRDSNSGGDWDPGYYKGQCGDGLGYVKGISKDSSGKIRSLLCCTARYVEVD
jgi:hypothetical protein